MSETETRCRVGIDVGGTFTDVVLEAGGVRTSAKVLTTSQAPEKGVIDGLQEALQKAGLTPGDVGLVLHGTTLATNAVSSGAAPGPPSSPPKGSATFSRSATRPATTSTT